MGMENVIPGRAPYVFLQVMQMMGILNVYAPNLAFVTNCFWKNVLYAYELCIARDFNRMEQPSNRRRESLINVRGDEMASRTG